MQSRGINRLAQLVRKMNTQLTLTEVLDISQFLQDYASAEKTLALLNETNSDLEKRFEDLWGKK